jgi:hypothetical protein
MAEKLDDLREVIERGCAAVNKGDAPDAIAAYLWSHVGPRLAEQEHRADQAEQQAASMRGGLDRFASAAQRLDLKTLLSIGLAPDDLDAAFRFLTQPPIAVEEEGPLTSERCKCGHVKLDHVEGNEYVGPGCIPTCPCTRFRGIGRYLVRRDGIWTKPAPQQHVEQPGGGDALAAQNRSGLVAEPGVDVPGARPEISEPEIEDRKPERWEQDEARGMVEQLTIDRDRWRSRARKLGSLPASVQEPERCVESVSNCPGCGIKLDFPLPPGSRPQPVQQGGGEGG